MDRKKSEMTKVKEMRDSEGEGTVQGQIMLRLQVTAQKGHTESQRQEQHRVKSTNAYTEQEARSVKNKKQIYKQVYVTFGSISALV
jgi:hypothetical protein